MSNNKLYANIIKHFFDLFKGRKKKKMKSEYFYYYTLFTRFSFIKEEKIKKT